MVDISAYAPPLSAVGAARTATASAVNVATSYGERPSFRDDAVTASAATRAMSSKTSRLNDVRALERVDGLLDVTLATTDAIVDTLTEMKTLAVRLQDQSLSDDMRATLTHEYNKLLPRIDELTEVASFGGRNLINPAAAQISGDLELPGGQMVEARDLRSGRGVVEALDPPIKAEADELMAAFALDGSLAPQPFGAGGMTSNMARGGSSSFEYITRERGDLAMKKNGTYHDLKFTPKAASGFMGSFKAHAQGSLFQYDYGGQRIVFSLNLNDELEVLRNGASIAATQIDVGEWNQIGLVNLPSGDLSVYLNGHRITAFSYTPPSTPTTISLLMHAGATYDDVAVYGSDTAETWDDTTIPGVMAAARAGIHNWSEDRPTASSWASVAERVSASLSNVQAVQASIGGAARTAELKAELQQRMVDAIDTAAARLVNRDIDRLGALRAAGEVREQLGQAMMQSQTTTLSAQTSLFSNALGLFDSMNIGGFRPMGLETAGARGGL